MRIKSKMYYHLSRSRVNNILRSKYTYVKFLAFLELYNRTWQIKVSAVIDDQTTAQHALLIVKIGHKMQADKAEYSH